MRKEALFPGGIPPAAAVETVDAEARNPACKRCHMVRAARNPCLPASAPGKFTPGTAILVVMDETVPQDDDRGMTASGPMGAIVRRMVTDCTTKPVVYTAATRCPNVVAAKGSVPIDNCRPYLAGVVQRVDPERIICVGTGAMRAVLGHGVSTFDTRRGYGFLSTGVPVFFVAPGWAIASNQILRRWTAEDVRWAVNKETTLDQFSATYSMIDSDNDAKKAVAYCYKKGVAVVFDVETFGKLFTAEHRIVRLAISPEGSGRVFVWDDAALQDLEVAMPLLKLLADPDVPKTGANMKYDINSVFCMFGIITAGPKFDIRLVRKLQQADAGASLDTMSYLVGAGGYKGEFNGTMKKTIGALLRKQKNEVLKAPWGDEFVLSKGEDAKKHAFAMMPSTMLTHYNAQDVHATGLVAMRQREELGHDDPAAWVFSKVTVPAVDAVAQVERWGIRVDPTRIKAADLMLGTEVTRIKMQLASYGLTEPGSPQQVAAFFFDKLKLTSPDKRNPRGTDADVLAALKGKHPAVELVSEFRKTAKFHSSYVVNLPQFIADDGRVHADIKLDGAETARLSITDPALQTIPKRGELAKTLRKLFVAESSDHTLVHCDYSQVEIRVAALLSGDPKMIEILKSGVDYHLRTAQMLAKMVWGKDPATLTKESPERDACKTINFAILYGKGAASIAADLKITVKLAEKLIAGLYGELKVLAKWIEKRTAETVKYGYAWTILDEMPGHRRPLWQVAGSGETAGSAKRSGVNTPIQGTAGYFCTRAMIDVTRWILKTGVRAKCVLPIHDALIVDCHNSCLDLVGDKLVEIMESYWFGDVPLLVDREKGPSWGELEKWPIVRAV